MKSYFVKFAACLNKEDTAAARLKSKHESQQWAGFKVNTKNQNGQGNLSMHSCSCSFIRLCSAKKDLKSPTSQVLLLWFSRLRPLRWVFSEEYPNELFGCNLRNIWHSHSHLKMDLTTPQLTGVAQWFSNANKPKKSKMNREVSILILICVE